MIVNDLNGMCMGSTISDHKMAANADTIKNSGIYTSLLSLASKLKPSDGDTSTSNTTGTEEGSKRIIIETTSKQIFIKEYDGHAVALHVRKSSQQRQQQQQTQQALEGTGNQTTPAGTVGEDAKDF